MVSQWKTDKLWLDCELWGAETLDSIVWRKAQRNLSMCRDECGWWSSSNGFAELDWEKAYASTEKPQMFTIECNIVQSAIRRAGQFQGMNRKTLICIYKMVLKNHFHSFAKYSGQLLHITWQAIMNRNGGQMLHMIYLVMSLCCRIQGDHHSSQSCCMSAAWRKLVPIRSTKVAAQTITMKFRRYRMASNVPLKDVSTAVIWFFPHYFAPRTAE